MISLRLPNYVNVYGSNVYVFHGGGIIKSRTKVIHEGQKFSCLQSLLISGWAVAG